MTEAMTDVMTDGLEEGLESTTAFAMPNDSLGAVGRAIMRNAAGRALAAKSDDIATKLAESAAGGDINSTKLLVALSEGALFKGVRGTRKIESLARRLSLEPEWNEEQHKGKSAVGTNAGKTGTNAVGTNANAASGAAKAQVSKVVPFGPRNENG